MSNRLNNLHVEEGVSIEEVAAPRTGAPARWDWSQLRVGPHPAVFDSQKEYKAAKASASRYFRRVGGKVVGRKCMDGKYRIWRTA